MTHKAEQILDAFTTAVTGLTTTGANVARDRVYKIEDAINEALSIYQGPDKIAEEGVNNFALQDRELVIFVDIAVAVGSGNPVTQTTNLIREEMEIALQADPTLGLSFVWNLEEAETPEAEISTADTPIATTRVAYTITYRRSTTDPGA